jgi:integrase
MRWDELGPRGDWTLPARRNKTKVDLVRPLSRAAIEELPPRADGFVFSTDGGARPISGFSKFKASFDKACRFSGWTIHDLRRTARTLMSRAGVDADHAERALGHVSGVYDRHAFEAEKRRAFEALAREVERITSLPALGS